MPVAKDGNDGVIYIVVIIINIKNTSLFLECFLGAKDHNVI